MQTLYSDGGPETAADRVRVVQRGTKRGMQTRRCEFYSDGVRLEELLQLLEGPDCTATMTGIINWFQRHLTVETAQPSLLTA